jgi:hypothetical protein
MKKGLFTNNLLLNWPLEMVIVHGHAKLPEGVKK